MIYNNEIETLHKALAALEKKTGLIGKVDQIEPYITQGKRVDAEVKIEANGQQYTYLAELKRADRFTILAELRFRQDTYGHQLLLVAPRVTAEMAEKCRELDLQFIDGAGNAYLRQPGLYVLVKGERPLRTENIYQETDEFKKAVTPTNLRAVFVILCKPALLNAPYRDIKDAAGIALGAVGWVFFNLNGRGFTVGGEKKGRMLIERQRLAQEWVTNYPIKLRPKLNGRRFTAPIKDWWKTTEITKYNAQWGGEVAAAKLTQYLKPDQLTIYVHMKRDKMNLTQLVMENKLRPDPDGEIEILEAFWNFKDEETLPETVPPLLIYADLLATMDPRNLETANMIYDQYFGTHEAET